MEKTEEKAIFDRATEKLDLYVPLCLEDNCADDAAAFLQPGGPYVRFALKEFMKELLFELIKPVGEWTKDPYYIDVVPIYETVKHELAEILFKVSNLIAVILRVAEVCKQLVRIIFRQIKNIFAHEFFHAVGIEPLQSVLKNFVGIRAALELELNFAAIGR